MNFQLIFIGLGLVYIAIWSSQTWYFKMAANLSWDYPGLAACLTMFPAISLVVCFYLFVFVVRWYYGV